MSDKPLKRQSLKVANRCEQAQGEECRCRCNGALHGARRGEGEGFFASLPETDPHFVETKDMRRERINREKREETALRNAAWLAEWNKTNGIALPAAPGDPHGNKESEREAK